MSIENNIERIAGALEIIALAVASKYGVPSPSQGIEPVQEAKEIEPEKKRGRKSKEVAVAEEVAPVPVPPAPQPVAAPQPPVKSPTPPPAPAKFDLLSEETAEAPSRFLTIEKLAEAIQLHFEQALKDAPSDFAKKKKTLDEIIARHAEEGPGSPLSRVSQAKWDALFAEIEEKI